jgi:hypothetical protein
MKNMRAAANISLAQREGRRTAGFVATTTATYEEGIRTALKQNNILIFKAAAMAAATGGRVINIWKSAAEKKNSVMCLAEA